jgi:hypothetical protein
MAEKLSKIGLIGMTEEVINDVDNIQHLNSYERTLYGLERAIENLAGNVLVLGLVVKEILKRTDIK